MKKAEQYLKEYVGRRYPNTDYNSEEVDIMEAIKQAQIDAFNEAIELAAENAEVKYDFVSTGDYSGYTNYILDKNSILKLKIK